MAVSSPPFFEQAGSHAAKTFRQMLSAVMGVPVVTGTVGISTAWGGGHGVVGLNDLKVTQRAAGVNRSVDVSAGYALIMGTSSLAQGTYAFANDAVENLPLSTADPANPRIDVIVAQIRDNTEDAGGSNTARLFAVTGTPGAVPVAPTVPAGSLVLAYVTVAAADTTIVNADITDKRTWAAALGGKIRCLSTLRPSVPLEGMYIYEIDTDRTWYYNGTAWQLASGPVPYVMLTPSAVTSLANITDTAVAYATETEDLDGLHDGVSTSRITIPAALAGKWRFSFTAGFAANATGYRQFAMRKNGAGRYYALTLVPLSGTAVLGWFASGSVDLPMAAGDYMQVVLNQSSGGALNSGGNATVEMFQATYIGPT